MSISYYELPVVFRATDIKYGISTIPTSTIYDNTVSGTESVIVNLPILSTRADINDLITSFNNSLIVDSDITNIVNEIDMQFYNSDTTKIYNELWQEYLSNSLILINNDLFFYDNNLLQKSELNSKTSFRINIGSISINKDIFTELYLCEPKYFVINTDIFCTISGTLNYIIGDIQQQLGKICPILSDIYSTNSAINFIDSELYCATIGSSELTVDISTTSGSIDNINTDVYSVTLSTDYNIKADIKVRSIFINNFFLNVDHFTTASSVGYIEVIDYVYPISEVKTYIIKDGTTLSGTYFEDIPFGKRLYFDPVDNFYSDGEIILSFHSESIIGEILDEDFYLLYGYNLELGEVVKWKPNQRIVVRGEATNLSFCPNKEGFTYYFDTADLQALNLPVSINPVVYDDLIVSIYPQSTTFFYSKTYTIKVVGVKDFQGNIMEPFYYTFTIENPIT